MEEKENVSPESAVELLNQPLTQPCSNQSGTDLLLSLPLLYLDTQFSAPTPYSDTGTQPSSAQDGSPRVVSETLVRTGSTDPVAYPASTENLSEDEKGGWSKRVFSDKDMAILQLQSTKTYLPWFKDFDPFIIGYKPAGTRVALFDCSALGGVLVDTDKSRSQFLADAFFRMRYYEADQDFLNEQAKHVSHDSLSNSWNECVVAMEEGHALWFSKLHELEENFFNFNVEGMKIKIHLKSIEDCGRCCLRAHYQCPMCYSDSARASKETRKTMSPELFEMLIHFKTNWENHVQVEKDQALLDRLDVDTLTRQAESSYDKLWFDQRMRNTDSEVFKNYRMNHGLARQLSATKDHENNLQSFVRELKDNVDAFK
ncbi:hypothetical protein F442_07178, partial [Phytophthora nicotianae P10297]